MSEKLRKEITKALKILPLNDRDLRTIAIYCNPNNPGHEVSLGGYTNKTVLIELESMEKKGLISRQKKWLFTTKKKEYELWSLI